MASAFAIMGESGKCLNTIPAHVNNPDEGLPMPTRSLKYRLFPNQAQAEWLTGQLREGCELYNAALEERRGAWKTCGKTVSFREQSAQLKHLRAQGLVAIPNFNCADAILRRLDRAYSALFRRGYGFPRFRSVHRFDSITFPKYSDGFSVYGDRLRLQGCSLVRINLHRPIEGKIKTATVKREGDRWFVILVCQVSAQPLPAVEGQCGIDVGLTSFVALSDGSTVAAPQFFRKAQAKLRRAQRHLAEWDGQEGVCAGKITNITNPEPGSYVLWVDVSGTEFYVNASLARPLRGHELVKPLVDEADEGLKEFLRNSSALKTKVEHRWSAWLDDREDGIVGTGATELEAIEALAAQHTSGND